MKSRCRFLFVLSLIFNTSASLMHGRHQLQIPDARQAEEEYFHTVINFDATDSPDPRRRARSKRSNVPAENNVNPELFRITEDRESAFGLLSSHARTEPAFPSSESDAIVVGEVVSADAFLSEDKTTIMSEFKVQVEEILKDNPVASLMVGHPLTAIRGGGGVRFPSGKIIRQGQLGRPLPRTGQRYVFFLKFNNDEGQDYNIMTGYELRGGKVTALDGALMGDVIKEYAAYQEYNGVEEQTFLAKVKGNLLHGPPDEVKK